MLFTDFERDPSGRLIDYYAALGVPKTATTREINSVYRRLALRYHPDKNAGDLRAANTFAKLTFFKDVLVDDNNRRDYDRAVRDQNRDVPPNRLRSHTEREGPSDRPPTRSSKRPTRGDRPRSSRTSHHQPHDRPRDHHHHERRPDPLSPISTTVEIEPIFGGYSRPWPQLGRGEFPAHMYRGLHDLELLQDIVDCCEQICRIARRTHRLLESFEELALQEIEAVSRTRSTTRRERRAAGMFAVVTDLLIHILELSALVYDVVRQDIYNACDSPHLLCEIYDHIRTLSDAWLATRDELRMVERGMEHDGWTTEAVVESIKVIIDQWDEKVAMPQHVHLDVHNVLEHDSFVYQMRRSDQDYGFDPLY